MRQQAVTRSAIQKVANRIAREFKPDRVVLFGSHANGTPRRDSDVDLLVVLQFEGKGLWKSIEIMNRIRAPFPLDLIARKPDDTARRYEQGDPLIHEALDHGQTLYERRS